MEKDRINRLIQEAGAEPEPGRSAEIYLSAARICLENNLHHQACEIFQTASDLFSQAGRLERQVYALNELAVALIAAGRGLQALETINRALQILKNIPNTALISALTGNQGLAHASAGDYQKAAKCHKKVFESAEQAGNKKLKLNALINLAECNLLDGHLQPALGFALVGQDVAAELGSKTSAIMIYDLLGKITARQGNLKKALEYHQSSYQLALEQNDLQRQAVALANQALALEGLTKLDQAYQKMKQAQEIFSMINSEYRGKTSQDLTRIAGALPTKDQ